MLVHHPRKTPVGYTAIIIKLIGLSCRFLRSGQEVEQCQYVQTLGHNDLRFRASSTIDGSQITNYTQNA